MSGRYTVKDKKVNGFIVVVDIITGKVVKRFKTVRMCAAWIITNQEEVATIE